jgi:lipoprotein NlpI
LPALDRRIAAEPDNIALYSERGDALFFLGQFDAAVRDYSQMVILDPGRDASHWRRGIAWFYAGEFEKAAGQFERYHSFDKVDRENGIWRYLCQVKAHGVETARRGLLRYEKDDRPPFPDVYRLFSGDTPPDQILEHIAQADAVDLEREKRLFYAHLYIGLWHAVHDRPQQARFHLEKCVENTWAPTAGYGPRYMWHVARLHRERLPPTKAH